ncbi:hypothetical protein HMSSN139_56910 [Paenibacillus sp. HMSSN-139]|nr:hypothetical protein HMSSN139_56910 [Paenibacillus sp. HMSSN-139]
MTNVTAWIPTLFFMIAVTIVETVGVLKIGVNSATAWIVAPLIACNAYQILILQRVLSSGKPETQKAQPKLGFFATDYQPAANSSCSWSQA